MKRLFAAVLALLMFACACAEEEYIATAFEVYAQSFLEVTEAEWEADDVGLLQMLELSETVTVSVCLEEGAVAAVTVEYPCGEPPQEVRAAIGNLGWLSEEALDQAMVMEPDAMLETEGCTIWRVHGENRDAFSICRTEKAQNMLWQPIHGGEKIHDTPRCSGMDVSRMITSEAAALTGWEDCGTCRADHSEEEESEKEETGT